MSNCTIRYAKVEDIPAIMGYIDSNWKKDHILARDRRLFEWQYMSGDNVNIVIGVDEQGIIQGMLGFVPYGTDEKKDIALALWKANKSESFLGIKLLLYLKKNEPHMNIVCPGINMKTTSKIYQQVGMEVGTMKQWYRLASRKEYRIAVIESRKIPVVRDSEYHVVQCKTEEEFCEKVNFEKIQGNVTPQKTKEYFVHRYYRHPIYKYNVYVVADDSNVVQGVLVLRVQEHEGAAAVRFVDYIGKPKLLSCITSKLDKIMEEFDAEYIDMYETGIDDNYLVEGGWQSVKQSFNIIPNYFSPFEKRVVDICYSTSDSSAVLFRGDGDQDRPN